MDAPALGNCMEQYMSTRFLVAFLGSVGVGIVNGLLLNLPIVMMGMLNYGLLTILNTAVGVYNNLLQTDSVSSYYNNIAVIMSNVLDKIKIKPCLPTDQSYRADLMGIFLWTPEQQGLILSSYFWGYFISQLMSLSNIVQVSPKWTILFGVVINMICTLLTPMLTKIHYYALMFLRIMQGVGGGVTLPAYYVLLSKWTPPVDRNKARCLLHTITLLSSVISIALSGILTVRVGWQSVFYVMGALSFLWCGAWIALVKDTPQKQSFISLTERNMIITSLKEKAEESRQNVPIPWRSVISSKPFLAILMAYVCCNWGWYMLLIELPSYLKLVLKLNTTHATLVMALSLLSTWTFSVVLSLILNWLQNKNFINNLTARKTATLIGTLIPAICLFLLCFATCDRISSVCLIALSTMCSGGMYYGFFYNYDEIAPNFADKLIVVTELIVTIPRITVPIFAAAMIHGNNKYGFFFIFGVTIFLYIVAFIAYCAYASTKEQQWNKDTKNNNFNV